MFKRMKEDIAVVFEQDPAASSKLEVILTYAGLHAIWSHRIAHALYKKKFFFLHESFHKLVDFLQVSKFIQEQQLGDVFL